MQKKKKGKRGFIWISSFVLFFVFFIHTALIHSRHFTLIVSFPEAPCFAPYRSAQQSLFRQQWQILGAESSSLSLRQRSCPTPPPLSLLLCPLKKLLAVICPSPVQAYIFLIFTPKSRTSFLQKKNPSLTLLREVNFDVFYELWLIIIS